MKLSQAVAVRFGEAVRLRLLMRNEKETKNKIKRTCAEQPNQKQLQENAVVDTKII